MATELKPHQWRLGAKARIDNLGREANPFKFPNPNPKDNEPWSFWNHGWNWVDAQIRELGKYAAKGVAASVTSQPSHK